jgi:hypothetical protein
VGQQERKQFYEASALREEEAGQRAATEDSARVHRALAKLFRYEATKIGAVESVLKMAFGD